MNRALIHQRHLQTSIKTEEFEQYTLEIKPTATPSDSSLYPHLDTLNSKMCMYICFMCYILFTSQHITNYRRNVGTCNCMWVNPKAALCSCMYHYQHVHVHMSSYAKERTQRCFCGNSLIFFQELFLQVPVLVVSSNFRPHRVLPYTYTSAQVGVSKVTLSSQQYNFELGKMPHYTLR